MTKKIVYNFLAQIAGLLISFLDRLVLVGILIRVWGVDVYADWVKLCASAGLISLCELGIGIYFGNALAMAFAEEDEDLFNRIISTNLVISLVIGMTLLFGATFVFFVNVDQLLSVRSTSDSTKILFVLALAEIFHLTRGAVSQIYRGRGEFARGATIDTGVAAIKIGLGILVASLSGKPMTMALVFAASALVGGWGIMLFDLHRRYPQIQFVLYRPRRETGSDIFKNVAWYALVQGAPLAWLHVPILLLGAFGYGGASLVTYVAQRTMVHFGRSIVNMLSMGMTVELTGHFHKRQFIELGRIINAMGRIIASTIGIVVSAIFCFGSTLVAVWTGRPDLFDPVILFWMLTPAIIVAPALPLSGLCMYANRPQFLAVAYAVQLGIALMLAYPMVYNFGVAGLAISLAAGEILGMGILLPVLFVGKIDFRYLPHAIECMLVSIAACFWGSLVAWLLLSTFGSLSVAKLGVVLAIWTGMAVPPVLYISLPTPHRARLRAAFSRVLPRAC
jgi:O-antigen/teichoic acid export membrane protein